MDRAPALVAAAEAFERRELAGVAAAEAFERRELAAVAAAQCWLSASVGRSRQKPAVRRPTAEANDKQALGAPRSDQSRDRLVVIDIVRPVRFVVPNGSGGNAKG